MRFLFLLIISFASGLLSVKMAAAQNIRANAVFLKNGSVITGRITENDSIAGVKIANKCGVWAFTSTEIDSIGWHRNESVFFAKQRGYFNHAAMGLLSGIDQSPLPSIIMTNGYKFHPKLYTGLGVGYEYYDWSVLPVFADIRYYLADHGFAPGFMVQAGYAFRLENVHGNFWEGDKKTFGGFLWSAGAGIRAGIAKNTALTFNVCYRFQKLSYQWSNSWDPGTQNRTYTHYNRVAVSIGFLFE